MDDYPHFDSHQRAENESQRFLYAGAKNEFKDLQKAVAEESLAVAAGGKARRQQVVGMVIFLAALALIAVYAIFQIRAR